MISITRQKAKRFVSTTTIPPANSRVLGAHGITLTAIIVNSLGTMRTLALTLYCDLTDQKQYLHSKKIPLEEVDLRNDEDMGQLSFLDECDGMCGV